eukprot:scaffold9347_cov110-Isochrysis_galbana.AAC.2
MSHLNGSLRSAERRRISTSKWAGHAPAGSSRAARLPNVRPDESMSIPPPATPERRRITMRPSAADMSAEGFERRGRSFVVA